MINSKSDIKPLSESLSAPDSESGEKYISEPSQSSISTPHESSEPPSQRNIDPVTKGVALALFHTLPSTKKERYKEIKKSIRVKRETFRKIIRKIKARGYNFKIDKLRIR